MKLLSVGSAIIFCFLISNTANAQFNWVLWEYSFLGEGVKADWTVDGAFPNYDLCIKGLNDNVDKLRKATEKWPGATVNLLDRGLVVFFTDASGKAKQFIWVFKCLPESIDPRK